MKMDKTSQTYRMRIDRMRWILPQLTRKLQDDFLLPIFFNLDFCAVRKYTLTSKSPRIANQLSYGQDFLDMQYKRSAGFLAEAPGSELAGQVVQRPWTQKKSWFKQGLLGIIVPLPNPPPPPPLFYCYVIIEVEMY